jgi:hypothetical protein
VGEEEKTRKGQGQGQTVDVGCEGSGWQCGERGEAQNKYECCIKLDALHLLQTWLQLHTHTQILWSLCVL